MKLTVILLIFFISSACVVTSVRSNDNIFKINKLNLIWMKARHSLGSGKLKDLKNDLTKHELDEVALKKMKAHNQDKDGMFEAAVRKKLLTIMSKYSLDQYYDDVHSPIEHEHDHRKENLKNVQTTASEGIKSRPNFRDKRLDKLWKKAEKSGFSQEQLMLLHEEFEHQQDKLDEHYEAMETIEDELNKKMKGENSIENILDSDQGIQHNKETPSEKKARLEMNTGQNLKDKYSEIKKSIDKLQKKISSSTLDESKPFEEEPVNELWIAAVRANFTTEELDSFKEELEHYQTRIKKLKHFQVQLERNTLGAKERESNSESDEDKHIKRRVKELTYKVDKTYKSLEKRVMSYRRDEL